MGLPVRGACPAAPAAEMILSINRRENIFFYLGQPEIGYRWSAVESRGCESVCAVRACASDCDDESAMGACAWWADGCRDFGRMACCSQCIPLAPEGPTCACRDKGERDAWRGSPQGSCPESQPACLAASGETVVGVGASVGCLSSTSPSRAVSCLRALRRVFGKGAGATMFAACATYSTLCRCRCRCLCLCRLRRIQVPLLCP